MQYFENGQPTLNITYLNFFLPMDFTGNIADALELLAQYHRDHMNDSTNVDVVDWSVSCDSFKDDNKKLTASWSLSNYDSETNSFIKRLDN